MPWGLHKIAKVLRSSDVFHNAVNSVVREWNYEIRYYQVCLLLEEMPFQILLALALKAVLEIC